MIMVCYNNSYKTFHLKIDISYLCPWNYSTKCNSTLWTSRNTAHSSFSMRPSRNYCTVETTTWGRFDFFRWHERIFKQNFKKPSMVYRLLIFKCYSDHIKQLCHATLEHLPVIFLDKKTSNGRERRIIRWQYCFSLWSVMCLWITQWNSIL